MTRQEALRQVAHNIAGELNADTLEEASGFDASELDEMSDADAERIEWAVNEIVRRLRKIGSPPARRQRLARAS